MMKLVFFVVSPACLQVAQAEDSSDDTQSAEPKNAVEERNPDALKQVHNHVSSSKQCDGQTEQTMFTRDKETGRTSLFTAVANRDIEAVRKELELYATENSPTTWDNCEGEVKYVNVPDDEHGLSPLEYAFEMKKNVCGFDLYRQWHNIMTALRTADGIKECNAMMSTGLRN